MKHPQGIPKDITPGAVERPPPHYPETPVPFPANKGYISSDMKLRRQSGAGVDPWLILPGSLSQKLCVKDDISLRWGPTVDSADSLAFEKVVEYHCDPV